MISLHAPRLAVGLGSCVIALITGQPAWAAIGVTRGTPGVSSAGAASYEIPLTVPPGINGLTPRLSLRYSHGQGNGVVGIGWSIGGLSSIRRCQRTIAQDGFAAPVNVYD